MEVNSLAKKKKSKPRIHLIGKVGDTKVALTQSEFNKASGRYKKKLKKAKKEGRR